MIAYKCSCGCIHGWIDDPRVVKAAEPSRQSLETIWRCPRCERQHVDPPSNPNFPTFTFIADLDEHFWIEGMVDDLLMDDFGHRFYQPGRRPRR